MLVNAINNLQYWQQVIAVGAIVIAVAAAICFIALRAILVYQSRRDD